MRKKASPRFVNLKWDEIEKLHRHKWESLESHWGLSGTIAHWGDFNKGEVLKHIADSCIDDCASLLFSMEPLEYYAMSTEYCVQFEEMSWDERLALERALRTDLRNHLIISFLYNYFHENLEGKDFKSYTDALYKCENRGVTSATGKEDKDRIREGQKQLYKKFETKYKELCDRFQKDYDDVVTYETFTWVKQELEATPNGLAPLSAWFLAAYILEKEKYGRVFKKDKEDWFYTLKDFLRESMYFYALMPDEEHVTTSVQDENSCEKESSELDDRIMLYGKRHAIFAGIPISLNPGIKSKIPDTDYFLKDENGCTNLKMGISSRLQSVFNNYLIENNYHLYALSVVENYCRKLLQWPDIDDSFMMAMLMPTMISAPWLHGQMVEFFRNWWLNDRGCALMDRLIARWNNVGLPVLEELFVWRAWKYLGTPEAILDDANKWVECDETYDELIKIRFLTVDRYTKLKKQKRDTKKAALYVTKECITHNCLIVGITREWEK